MDIDFDACFATVVEIVKTAGKIVKEKFMERDKLVETKSDPMDLVTATDQEVEKFLIKSIKDLYPGHNFIGEESIAGGEKCNLTDDPTWIIDPIDGTMNFVHGFPYCAISVALFINMSPVIGIVYNPILDQLYTAQQHKGAFLNGNQIRVSDTTRLRKAMIMHEVGTSSDPEKQKNVVDNFRALVPYARGLRSLGSAALDMAMVATGAADGYFEFGIHLWDFAAAALIVKEAGGVVVDPNGSFIDLYARRILAASNQTLAYQMIAKIVQFYPQPRD